jgi:hypothetical protein
MWASGYYTLNDTLEREWGYSILSKAADQIKGSTGRPFIKAVLGMINTAYSKSMVMISSFSLDPDVLSQWRAYAHDGRGFAIGFEAAELEMPAKKLRVLYDEKLQLRELIGNLMHTYDVEKERGFKYGQEFESHWFCAGLDLCAYKNPGFFEEKEIRLAHVCGMAPDGKSYRFVSAGARGSHGARLSDPVVIKFRDSGGVIVPYIVLDYTNRGTKFPIKEVVLGRATTIQ